MHSIDLSKFNLRTDIALDNFNTNNDNENIKISKNSNVTITDVYIDDNSSKLYNKKVGNYITLEFDDITDSTNQDNIKSNLYDVLSKLIKVTKDDLVLIVGLGNRDATSDSLGPKVIDNIVVTNHLYELDVLDDNYYRVSAIEPNVTGITGIETHTIIKSIVSSIKPKLVIIIDSLASSSFSRLCKTIQITDTGINPGSGIGNNRKELSKDTLNTEVIALGVPTVIDLNKIINEDDSFIVTPNEIDYLINSFKNVISDTINDIFCD